MRPGRVIPFLAVVPCVPIILALLYWVIQYASVQECSNNIVSSRILPSLYWRQNITVQQEVHVERKDNDQSEKGQRLQSTSWIAVDRVDLNLSESSDIDLRGEFQRRRMSRMCRKYTFSREQHFPRQEKLKYFYRHLIFDDNKKVIFCFVPKVGCTNMKRLMLYMGGHLPLSTIDWPWVEDRIYLEPALKHASLMNASFTPSQVLHRLQTYYKFMVVRNPLERLLSAYINKIEPKVRYDNRENFPDYIKLEILQRYREVEARYWLQTAKQNPFNISVTFPEFIRHIIETDINKQNEHFRPSMELCHPCLVKYDFYANFKNISHDVTSLVEKFQTDRRYYRDESLHSTQEQTNRKLLRYYSQLSFRDKFQLVGTLYDELLFYYALYPSELDSHRQILSIELPFVN